jgi:endonuclease/exonuclease/phosphatase family protein
LGDFNADDSQTEQFERLQELMKLGYCEPDGDARSKPTFNDKTHIDYILVRNDLKARVKSYKVFEKGKGLSDHEPLIIDIDI